LGKFAVVDLESRGIDTRGSSCFSHESIVPAAYQPINTRSQCESGCPVPPILPLLRYPYENAGKIAESLFVNR
jgi:hypothetical protein